MNGEKKRLRIIIVACVLIGALSFAIYWSATEDVRLRNSVIADIKEDIAQYRSGESHYMYFMVFSSVADDPEFQDFLVTQVQAMYQNGEISLLIEFLDRLEAEDCCYESVVQAINDCLISSGSIEAAFEVIDKMTIPLDYYKTQLALNRNSQLIAEYIEQNGTKSITYTPGEGYYANEKDSTSKDVIGLPNSPLYDAVDVTYLGDFKCVHKYGVNLNAYYEETYYSREKIYFRDAPLSFSPFEGECVWSGEYLFCFDSSGSLIGFSKI